MAHTGVPPTGSVLPVWQGPPPGSETSTWAEQDYVVDGERLVRNVSVPTLEVVAPSVEPNGTAVVVAPGGAFHLLAIDNEGMDPARWLAARGVTALVLRYRLARTPEDDVEMVRFQRDLDARVRTTAWDTGPQASLGDEADRARALAGQDGRQAVRLLRAHAHEWGIDPDRVGFVGFSAGASVALDAAASGESTTRPDFVAALYGPAPDELSVPEGAPALFLVHALDDPAVPPSESVSVWQAWRAAGRPVELHVFQAGGHGFGTRQLGLGTDAWLPLFEGWMRALGVFDPSTARGTSSPWGPAGRR